MLQVAQQYLQFLLGQRKFAEAAELCPELLKVRMRFETFVEVCHLQAKQACM